MDKSGSLILIVPGSDLDPIYDSVAVEVALTHALLDNWMPQATIAKCIKDAHASLAMPDRGSPSRGSWQRLNAYSVRSLCVILPFGALMVDPIFHKRAARARQWRRVALYEGYEDSSRGAVFAPLRRAQQPKTYGKRASVSQAFGSSVTLVWSPLRSET